MIDEGIIPSDLNKLSTEDAVIIFKMLVRLLMRRHIDDEPSCSLEDHQEKLISILRCTINWDHELMDYSTKMHALSVAESSCPRLEKILVSGITPKMELWETYGSCKIYEYAETENYYIEHYSGFYVIRDIYYHGISHSYHNSYEMDLKADIEEINKRKIHALIEKELIMQYNEEKQ